MNKLLTNIINKNWLIYIILVAASFLVYLPVLGFSLTGCDDKVLINYADLIYKGSNSVSTALTSPYMFTAGLFYRPVVTLSFLTDLLFSNSPFTFHFFNILYFSAVCVLVFSILVKLNFNRTAAFCASLIFAVHPVFTNAVVWIPGRNDLLAAVFILISFLFLIKYLSEEKYSYLILNIIFFFIALFTKEIAVSFLFVGTAYLLLFSNKNRRRNIFLFLSWISVLVIWFVIRNNAVKDAADYSFTKNFGFLIHAAGKIFLPFNLAVLPTIPDTSYLFGLISIFILTVIILISKNKLSPTGIFGLTWFAVFILPSAFNVNPEFSTDLMLECRILLPSFGIFIFVFDILNRSKLIEYRKVLISAFILIIISFAGLSVFYSGYYKNEEAFWTRAVETSPSLDLSYSGLGITYFHADKLEPAEINYKKAIGINPNKPGNNGKLGLILVQENKPDEAAKYFKQEIALNQDDYDANLLLGIILFKRAELDEAEKTLLRAAKINQQDIQPVFYLMKLYHQKKNYTEAAKYANILKSKGVKIPPDIAKDLGM